MKKICSVILSCALLLGLLVVPGAAAEPAAKQDFEGEYTAYSSLESISASYAVTDAEYHSGGHSLKYDYSAANGYNLVNLTYQDDLKLTPGKTYMVSFWLMAPTPKSASTESTAIRLYANSAWINPWTNAGWNVGQQVAEINSNFQYNVWQQYTCTVKLSDKQNALHLYVLNGKHNFYIDDITATEVVPVTVDFKETDGTVIDQRMGLPGSALTLPRTPEKEGYSFDGWYEDADFTTAFTGTTFPTAGKTLYAKFKNESQSYNYPDEFESILKTEGSSVAYGATATVSDGVLKLDSSTINSAPALATVLTPNSMALKSGESYKISMDVKTPEGNLYLRIGAAIGNNIWNVANGFDTSKGNCFTYNTAAGDEWQTVTGELTVTNNGRLAVAAWEFNNGKTACFKNLKITPITAQTNLEKAVSTELDYQGSSLRPATGTAVPGNNGQAAIRFKSTISNELIANGITVDKVHYSVVEYGHTYFREDLMGGNTVLDIGTAYTSGKAAKNAVAYRKENGAVTTDIWFSKDETNVTYTAALYGFTEESYTYTYVARPYVKLVADDSTDEITVYGANTQFAAFNDVADRAFYAHPGDVYGREAAYTDVNGDSWSEKYEIRKALYDTVLSKLSGKGFNYLAPAAAAE